MQNPPYPFFVVGILEFRFEETLTPDLESNVEELCRQHDSSIFLGMAYGAFCI